MKIWFRIRTYTHLLFFLFSDIPLTYSSPTPMEDDNLIPITSTMIEQGLVTCCDVYTDIYDLAKAPRDLFVLKQIQVKPKGAPPFFLLLVNVLKQHEGFMHFFLWDESKTHSDNYRQVDQSIHEVVGHPIVRPNYVGMLHYTFGKFEDQTYSLSAHEGYQRKDLSDRPIYYAHINYLSVLSPYRNMGIGTKMIGEFTDFVFQTKSVNLVTAVVGQENCILLRPFKKHGFVHHIICLDKSKPNFHEYLMWDYNGHMISLDRGKNYIAPTTHQVFNYYLSYQKWKRVERRAAQRGL
jgi:GNAT superfamily N-acetyltransferase